MINIIAPEKFKSVPWKNGKGITTELAISNGGTLTDFDWRLSMASVVEDGPFSDFSGYYRNLVLIKGEGIDLQHDNTNTDCLSKLLDIAKFDGGCKTVGTLTSGPIIDFNIMTKIETYHADVNPYNSEEKVVLPNCDYCFVYCLSGTAVLHSHDEGSQPTNVPSGHLLQISPCHNEDYVVNGQQMIVIALYKK